MRLRYLLFISHFLLYSLATNLAGPPHSSAVLKNFQDLRNKVDKIDDSPIFEFGKVLTSVIEDCSKAIDSSIVRR